MLNFPHLWRITAPHRMGQFEKFQRIQNPLVKTFPTMCIMWGLGRKNASRFFLHYANFGAPISLLSYGETSQFFISYINITKGFEQHI